ncbi:hypothetical protein HYW75_01220 [Candidatus Pacearchaeota archaeon]|nr:hypothetical protein [Candidatus Pacearchaeota archaeon]
MIPRTLSETLNEITSANRPVVAVMVPSCRPAVKESLSNSLKTELKNLRIEEIIEYTPPRDSGRKRIETKNRIEKFSQVIKSNSVFLVMDDTFETGRTLRYATRNLIQQGVSQDRIYFFCYCLLGNGLGASGLFLDKASEFLKFRERYPKIEGFWQNLKQVCKQGFRRRYVGFG